MKKIIKAMVLSVCLAMAASVMLQSYGTVAAEATNKKPKLNTVKKTIYEGDAFKLKIEGTKGTIKWSSSNKKVATVSSKGLVKGISGGTGKRSCKIIAYVGNKKYVCRVTVKKGRGNLPHTHDWVAATCTAPKTCSICGKTKGDVLPHAWVDATCTAPKTCKECGKTEGEALGHDVKDWKIVTEATCDKTGKKSAVCNRCQKEISMDIPKLEHTKGGWTVTKNYKITREGSVTPGVETLACSVCGAELETREYTIELSTSQKNAIICAYKEIPFWHPSYDFLINDLLVDIEGFSYEDAKFAANNVDVDWDEQAILYARQHFSGMSRAGLIEEMRYYKFTEDQIEKALKEVGY